MFYSVSINQSQKMSLTRCAVSWQSADYWRKCHVKKYFSRFAKIFLILERFSDCTLFSIFMKFVCESMNLNRIWNCFLDLTNFSKAIFLLKRYREIRNIFSDLQNIFGLSLFDFRTEVFELFVLFWLQLYNYFTLIHISYTKNGQNKVVLGYYNFG